MRPTHAHLAPTAVEHASPVQWSRWLQYWIGGLGFPFFSRWPKCQLADPMAPATRGSKRVGTDGSTPSRWTRWFQPLRPQKLKPKNGAGASNNRQDEQQQHDHYPRWPTREQIAPTAVDHAGPVHWSSWLHYWVGGPGLSAVG